VTRGACEPELARHCRAIGDEAPGDGGAMGGGSETTSARRYRVGWLPLRPNSSYWP
jgi:hypothetical protein